MSQWDDMWRGLNLDFDRHCQLMEVLGDAYPQIYLGQENRPKSMEYFDFVISEVHGLRVRELLDHKEKGGKVVGTFCVYVPDEILLALGAIGVGLCGGADFSIPDAEKVLPRDLCPLIKSAFGFKAGRLCPYFESADLLVGETTCDGKKKVWEIMGEDAPAYVMELPQKKDSEEGRSLWRAEVRRLARRVEDLTGRTLTHDGLKAALGKTNARRRALERIYESRKADPAPISGKDALLVSQIAFYDDVDRFTEKANELAAELEARAAAGEGVMRGARRLAVTGTPMAIPNWKLHHILETSGAVVVVEETCTGTRYFQNPVVEPGRDLDETLDRIADRYLETPCACFTPNATRLENLATLPRDWNAAGVVQYLLKFCQTYALEGRQVEKVVRKAGVPILTVETDYGMGDVEQLTTRVKAFLEML